MSTKIPTLLAVALATLALTLGACSHAGPTDNDLALAAAAEDAERAASARARLREQGQPGLDALLDQHRDLIATCHEEPPGDSSACDGEAWSRVRAAVEDVAQQRDASRSGLYWYTDLGKAKARAVETGRPIVSLRLLGGLNEELTCANSRFFRTVLYANADLSRTLRESFVLHWESVRPVPKITIDFGDGRSMKTTLTGNSAHYVLTPDGKPIEVMPGLVGTARFATWLESAGALAKQLAMSPESERPELLATHHRDRLAELDAEFASDLEAVEETDESSGWNTSFRYTTTEDTTTEGTTTGFKHDIVFSTGSFIAYPDGTKMNIELPIAQGLIPDTEAQEQWFDRSTWNAIAERHLDETELDQRSRDLARWKTRRPASDMTPLFERLQRSVAEETVRTEYVGHRAVHRWFIRGEVGDDLEALTARLYTEVFGLPTNDAWMGLVPDEDYRALDEGGLSG